jgi:hypothetical protein
MQVFGQLRTVAGDDDAYFRESLDQKLARCGLALPGLRPTTGARGRVTPPRT